MTSPPAPGSPSFPPPGFRRFWAGEAISGLGSYVTVLALQTLVVLDLDGGATETGWLNAARWLPYLALGLVVGALVDRVRRRPVMIVSDLVRALLLALIPVAALADVLSLPLLLLVVVAYGAASLVNDGASQSFLPRLVPRGQLQRAHARLDGAGAVAETAGPPLGGLLARLVGAPVAVLGAAVGHVVSVVVVATLRTPEPPPSFRERGVRVLATEIVDGLRWAYGGSGLRRLALVTHLWFAGQGVLTVVLAPYALRQLDLSTTAFGLAAGAAGVGAALGAAGSTRLGRRLGTGGAIIAAHAVSAVGVLVVATAVLAVPGTAGAAVLLGLGQMLHGWSMGSSNSHEMSYRQAVTPDELQARTNTSLRSLNRAVLVVVSPLAGLLADRAGLTVALLVSAGVFAMTALLLLRSPFRRVRLDAD